MAQVDLDETAIANQEVADKQYGEATTALGDEMSEQIKQESIGLDTTRKQLMSNRKTFLDFVKERKERRESLSPPGAGFDKQRNT